MLHRYIVFFINFPCPVIPDTETERQDGRGWGQVLDRTDRLSDRGHMVVGRRDTTEREVWPVNRFLMFAKSNHMIHWTSSFCSLFLSLKFWSNNEPDDWKGHNNENMNGEDCVRMGEKSGYGLNWWFDKSCTAPQKRICEKSAETGRLKCVWKVA